MPLSVKKLCYHVTSLSCAHMWTGQRSYGDVGCRVACQMKSSHLLSNFCHLLPQRTRLNDQKLRQTCRTAGKRVLFHFLLFISTLSAVQCHRASHHARLTQVNVSAELRSRKSIGNVYDHCTDVPNLYLQYF